MLDYGLAPENRWPRQLQDALAAYIFLLDACSVSPRNVVIMGDSAGGNLALVATVAMVQQEASGGRPALEGLPVVPLKQGSSSILPGALVLLSPWVAIDTKSAESLQSSTWSKHADSDYLPSQELEAPARLFLPVGAPEELIRHPLVSPVFADPASVLSKFPKTLVSYGASEQLFGQIDWFCRKFAHANLDHPAKLKQLTYPGMPHVRIFNVLPPFFSSF